jgi:SAM-dependent methyltransferase
LSIVIINDTSQEVGPTNRPIKENFENINLEVIKMRLANYRIYLGVFLIALSLLMLEVTLTRIFSVILFYHFAVLSISLALFGASAAGVVVYLFPTYFQKEKLETMFTFLSLIYSISVVISFLVFLQIPAGYWDVSFGNFVTLSLTYVTLAIPFFFGGLVLSLVLATLASQVSLIYFADLIGAASGCLLALWCLDMVGGPGTVFVVAIVGTLASVVFSFRRQSRLRYVNLAWLGISVTILILNIQFNIYNIKFVKGKLEQPLLYERWNSFSRVTVFPENKQSGEVFGWGLSHDYSYDNPGWMRLTIDAMAETPIIHFNGDWESVRFLKYDVSALVYYLKNNSKVLVIGPGGGRDVLSALLFGAYQVDGVELNPLIVQAVRHNFADYVGHIYDDPRVHIYVDDGRNFLAKSSERYDVLQASAVDTWATTVAGAFALSENTLYTKEAFQLYRQHLTPDGILAFSRFVYPGDRYGEALRLTSLALAAWKEDGVQEPSQYMMLVGNLNATEDTGYVSLLLKNSPFSLEEVEEVEKISQEMGFSVLYAPFGRGHGVIHELVTSPDYDFFWESYSIDITPPTDDRPFFFQMMKVTDIPRLGLQTIYENEEKLRLVPIATLGVLLTLVSFLVLVFILGPMWFYRRRNLKNINGNMLFLLYNACLGIGFMLIEVGLIQKFVLFLGHPTYSLAVVLSSLLLSSGLGSFATRKVAPERASRVASRIGLGLIFLLPLYILFLPILQNSFMGLDQVLKIIISICGLFPIGLIMGTFFPLGIKLVVLYQAETSIPWYWAVNGATSVFASVFAIAVGLQFGIKTELYVGWFFYLIATSILFFFVFKQPPVQLGLSSVSE